MSIPPKAQKKKPLFQDARQQNMIGLKQGYNMLNLLILWKNYHINLKQGADITLHFVCVSIRGGNWVASQVKKDFVWTRLPLKRSQQLANLHHEVISSSTRHTFGFLYEAKGLHKQTLSGSMARCFLNEALRVGRMQSSASKLLERSEEILYGPMIYRRKEMDLLCHNSIFGTICMKFRKANGLQQNETFRKAQCPIVECLTNSSMMHGRNNGKKRITEIAGVLVSFDPKLILVNFLSFNHVNDVSRIKDEILNMVTGTRLVLLVIIAHSVKEKGEYKVIKKAIEKMGLRHKEPIAAYRDGNERRLTRFHETTDINTFLMWQIYSCGT